MAITTRSIAQRIAQASVVGLTLLGLGIGSMSTAHAWSPTFPPAQDRIYFVDNALDNGTSQFYIINPHIFEASPLGPTTNHDFEDVAISFTDHDLFASTGSDRADDKGMIYRVNGETGEPTLVGPSGFDRITIMKFRASDNTLWGWAEGKGLVQLDQNTGKGTLVFKNSKKFEGMAWQPDGKLYLAVDKKLYVLDLAANKLTLFASNLPKGTEALEASQDGVLLGGAKGDKHPTVFNYDIATKQVVGAVELEDAKSIEGLAIPSGLFG